MLGRVVQHVAALAERCQILWLIVGRIMIEVSTGEDDIGRSAHLLDDTIGTPTQPPALAVSPCSETAIPPSAIA